MTTCPRREEIMVETKRTEGTLSPLSVPTVDVDAPKTRLWRDSRSRTLSMLHQRRILKNKGLLKTTWFPSCTSRCSTASPVPFTPELWRWDQWKIGESELLPKEFKETLQARSFRKETKTNESIWSISVYPIKIKSHYHIVFVIFLSYIDKLLS